MKYIISQQANQDLENIGLYTFENWSVKHAHRYSELIMDEMEYISINPDSGMDFSSIRKEYYGSRIKSHFIFYRINKKNNVV